VFLIKHFTNGSPVKESNTTCRDSWHATSCSFLRRKRVGRICIDASDYFQNRSAYRVGNNYLGNWLANIEEQPKLLGVAPIGRESGGVMCCVYARHPISCDDMSNPEKNSFIQYLVAESHKKDQEIGNLQQMIDAQLSGKAPV
jgi:hypothetical protein